MRWAGLLILLGGLAALIVVLVTGGVEQAGRWTSVLSLVVAITGAVVTLTTPWLQQRATAGQPAGEEQLVRAAEVLRVAVRQQWRSETEARSLGDPDPMPVPWRLSDPAVMDHDEQISSNRLRFAGRSDQIAELTDQFRRLRRRRLVILGPAGSGKTTLAVQLVLHLLESRQDGEPVPVLFSLASWDPETHPRVQTWLAIQLNQTYPALRAFGPDTAQRLADQGRLLFVLDGMDEIPTERRSRVIERLNASLHADTGLIVTSRADEYTEAVHTGDVLTAAAVIEADPLTTSDATSYLKALLPRHADDSWQTVLKAVQGTRAGALAEVVSSPLGLWLLRVVYIEGRRDPRSLIDSSHYPDPAAIQNHLLEELIPATLRARPPLPSGQDPLRPTQQHSPEQVRRWLTTVASELREAQTRDWRWWEFAPHTLAKWQIALAGALLIVVVGALVGALLVGLFALLVGALVDGLHAAWSDLAGGLKFGLTVGLAVGLAGGLAFALRGGNRDAPVHADFRLRGRTRTLCSHLMDGLATGLVLTLAVALVVGLLAGLYAELVGGSVLMGGLSDGLQLGLMLGLAVGLVVAVPVGLISFVASPSIAKRATSPAEGLRGDRRLTVFADCMLSLMGGLGILLLWFWLLGGRLYTVWEIAFLAVTVLFGLLLGAALGPALVKTCAPLYFLASLWLFARRRLPLRLMRFLDDAYRLELLRIVGPVYQFRHAALQDHLAPAVESTASASAVPSTPH